jgi:MFS family permease
MMSRPNRRHTFDMFDTMRIPHVGAYTIGRAAAIMGTHLVSVAVGWELYERTRDPWALGLVGIVQAGPALALSIPGGEAADRFSRRTVAMLAHALLGLGALGLALVSWLSGPVELVYALLLLTGVGRAFSGPALTALLPELLEPRQFARANAWVVLTSELAAISGPVVGGLLIALTGAAGPAYLAALVAQFTCVGLLMTIPALAPPPRSTHANGHGLFDGITFIRRSPVYLSAITLDLFGVLFGGAMALLPIFARDILQVGPIGLGLLRAAPAAGAMAMALLVTRQAPWQRPGRVILLIVVSYGVASIGFGLSRDLLLSLACLCVTGACNTISVVVRKTLQQVITPNRLRGRVSAIGSLFSGLADELGAFESGAVAALFGPVVSVVSGGIGTIVVAGLVALVCPALARIGPLHTLRPPEPDPEPPLASPSRSSAT